MTAMRITFLFLATVGAMLVFSVDRARADFVIDVTWDSSVLVNHPANGPYYLDFTVIPGGGLNPDNNKFVVNNFQGVTAVGPAVATGEASGSIQNGFSLTAGSTFLNDIFQEFTPGQSLSFSITIQTPISIHGPTPDSFSFQILEGEGQNLTDNPFPLPLFSTATNQGNLLEIDVRPNLVVGGTHLSSLSDISTYGSDPVNADFPFQAPTATTPEPATIVMASCAIGLIGIYRLLERRTKRSRRFVPDTQ